MREIKFRAWSKRMELMIPNETMVEAGRQIVMFIKNARPNLPDQENAKGGLLLPTDDSDLVFMQYTGLKDRNGVEIFEGDILFNKRGYSGNERLLCRWQDAIDDGNWTLEKPGFRFDRINGTGTTIWVANKDSEVIGNIYSTPNLLEQ